MYKYTSIFGTIAAISYGIGYTIAPAVVASFYVDEPNISVHVLAMCRYFGLTLLFVGVVLWGFRNSSDSQVKAVVGNATIVVGVVGLLTSAALVLNGTLKPFGWSAVALYLVLTVGMLMAKKEDPLTH